MRKGILLAGLLLTLIVVNVLIYGKERIVSEGESMLLELRPRDPRSLMQGDYMVLRYRIQDDIQQQLPDDASSDGHVVVLLDEHQVARFQRLYDASEMLAEEERLIRYRKRGGRIRLASEAFFFQEGHGPFYRGAQYGELRVDKKGGAVLVGLRDAGFDELKPIIPETAEASPE